MTETILLQSKLTWGGLESLLSKHLSASKKADEVVFDASRLEWAGLGPSVSIAQWASQLADDRVVRFELPAATAMSEIIRDTWLGLGLVGMLREAEVLAIDSSWEATGSSVPVRHFGRVSGVELDAIEDSLVSSDQATETRRIISDTVRHVIFELLENAAVHTPRGEGHLVARTATASGRTSAGGKGLVRVFRAGQRYLEVLVWDDGRGIDQTLEPAFPQDYVPPWAPARPRRLLKVERVLAWAFEFTSTSNQAARRERIQEILDDATLPPERVATGLFNAVRSVRHSRGQLIVRTPGGLFGLDFSGDGPRLAGKSDLGIRGGLAKLSGTRVLLRIPLESAAGVHARTPRPVARLSGQMPVVEQVARISPSLGQAGAVAEAISAIDQHLLQLPVGRATVVIPPLPVRLNSRAASVLAAALLTMDLRGKDLVWLDASVADVVGGTAGAAESTEGGVLVGDVNTGEFSIVGRDPARTDSTLTEDALRQVRVAYREHCAALVVERLRESRVLRRGLFLIENKYYTEAYFHVRALLESPYTREACAQSIALSVADRPPDVVVGGAAALGALPQDVAGLLRKMGMAPIVLQRSEGPPTSTWLIRQMLELAPRRELNGLVLTDVICRGEAVADVLQGVLGLGVIDVHTLVDARPEEEEGRPLVVFSNPPRHSVVSETLRHPIVPSRDRPRARVATGDGRTERLFVIDQDTGEPIPYERSIAPKLAAVDVLRSLGEGTPALNCGHLDFNGRHYQYFLDLPQLAAALRPDLEDWFAELIRGLTETSPDVNRWHISLFNPDGSLNWLRGFSPRLPRGTAMEEVTADQLGAPPSAITRERDQGCVGMVPVMASAETLMRFADYLLSRQPKHIVLVALAVRSPEWLSRFLASVSHYRETRLSAAYFLEFPFGTYRQGREFCPVCHRSDLLSARAEVARRVCGANSSLAGALLSRAVAEAPQPIARVSGSPESLPSKDDLARARIRALYDRADRDLHTRRRLNRLLGIYSGARVLFLELLAQEWDRKEFRPDELEVRLYRAWPRIKEEAYRVLDDLGPPNSVHPVLWALALVIPGYLDVHAKELVTRYRASPVDLETIFAVLTESRLVPEALGELLSGDGAEQDDQHSDYLGQLVSDYLRVAGAARAGADPETRDLVANCARLWAQLARTSRFDIALDQLRFSIEGGETLMAQASLVHTHWIESVAPLLAEIRQAPAWRHIGGAHGDSHVLISELVRRVDQIGNYAKGLGRRGSEELPGLAETARDLAKDLADYVYGFFINPTQLDAIRHARVALSQTRLRVRERPIGDDVGLVFCDRNELEGVCAELLRNWVKKASTVDRGHEVWIDVTTSDDHVTISFGDDLPGDFEMDSWGGLRSVRDFCATYGAGLDVAKSAEGEKALSIALRRIPTNIDRTTVEGPQMLIPFEDTQ